MMKKLICVLMTPIMALFTMSCATSHSLDAWPIWDGERIDTSGLSSWPSDESALSWLMKQQRDDGHWGEDGNRVPLTSLATLAFLSQNETPMSPKYGKCVKKALNSILRDIDAGTKQQPEAEAIRAWCLAEAYGMTLNPIILNYLRVEFNKLDFRNATPWHVFAADTFRISGAPDPYLGESALATMRSTLPHQADSLLNQATHAYLEILHRDSKQAGFHLDAVRRLSPAKWREQETPLLSTLVLSNVFFGVGGKYWQEWQKIFYDDVRSRQKAKNSISWWTAEALSVDPSSLPEFARSDTAVYLTSMVLLTFPPFTLRIRRFMYTPQETDLLGDED